MFEKCRTDSVKIQAPATLRKHELLDEETAPPSVAAPLPGQSYNPSQQEYQQLLDSATSTLQTQEEKNQQLEQVKSQFDNIRAVRGGKELWELAQDEIMQDNEAEAEVESSATAGNVEESSPKKKQSKQKTSKEKKKRASNINKEVRPHSILRSLTNAPLVTETRIGCSLAKENTECPTSQHSYSHQRVGTADSSQHATKTSSPLGSPTTSEAGRFAHPSAQER